MNPVTLATTIACCACGFFLAKRLGGDQDTASLVAGLIASYLAASTDLFDDPRG